MELYPSHSLDKCTQTEPETIVAAEEKDKQIQADIKHKIQVHAGLSINDDGEDHLTSDQYEQIKLDVVDWAREHITKIGTIREDLEICTRSEVLDGIKSKVNQLFKVAMKTHEKLTLWPIEYYTSRITKEFNTFEAAYHLLRIFTKNIRELSEKISVKEEELIDKTQEFVVNWKPGHGANLLKP